MRAILWILLFVSLYIMDRDQRQLNRLETANKFLTEKLEACESGTPMPTIRD